MANNDNVKERRISLRKKIWGVLFLSVLLALVLTILRFSGGFLIDFTNRESITTAILSAAVSFITIQISNKEEIPGFDNRVFVNTILNIPLFLTSLVLSFFILPSLIVISPDANGLPAFIGLFIYFLVWMIPYVYYFLLIMWSLLWIRNDRMGKEYYCKTIGFKDYIRLDYLKSTKSDKRDLIFNLESMIKS